MFLEKLEIQGFKSFATKNVLVFPGMMDKETRGITSIVGPNGSGKSNVADAVRWALGEQSMKTLRGKKSEDVIFSGSDKKGKLGMAEVSLFLNNEDGAREGGAIDYSQIVLTRRLYRSGDSEYLLNGSRVRLSDIQMLLARAKFGQKTYSVIGQGMVEGFLNTSLAERKEFFDEATGVKQYQIKRDEALNKLRSSYENLSQAQMLLVEIEPRLRSLTRQVSRLEKRGELEKELGDLQARYYSDLWQEIHGKFSAYNKEYLELEKQKFAKEKKLDSLNRDLEQMKNESAIDNEFDALQAELNAAQNKKNEYSRSLMKIEANREARLEAGGKHDLAFLLNRKESLRSEIEDVRSEIEASKKEQDGLAAQIAQKEPAKFDIEKAIQESRLESGRIQNSGAGSGDSQKRAHEMLAKIVADLEAVDEATEPGIIKELTLRIKKELKELHELLTGQGAKNAAAEKLMAIQARLSDLAAQKEEAVNAINEIRISLSGKRERARMLEEKFTSLERERADIEKRIRASENEPDQEELMKEQDSLKKDLEAVDGEIGAIRERIGAISAREDAKRSRLFGLQREISAVQSELNAVTSQLQSIKINATRYETKLEDLEAEIRQEMGGLEAVKDGQSSGFDEAKSRECKEKIAGIKKQLELIGGIDPQAQEEYRTTKERFDFFTGQINDFTDTVDSLRKIIKELDVTIKDQFDKEFKVIAGNFEKYFKILFNGGSAKIVKVLEDAMDEDAPQAEAKPENGSKKSDLPLMPDLNKIKFLQKYNATGLAGIEIQATPPGKKIQSISMLSGGERALTAIALICAIINSNPSPFVVLDEVDAALDEANSERLAKILEELSHKTQFIVITHNRAPMRRSAILYGVTMGDDGVSKLLSVKLEEVKTGR